MPAPCPFCGAPDRMKCVNWKKVRFVETEADQKTNQTVLTETQFKKWRHENCKDGQIKLMREVLLECEALAVLAVEEGYGADDLLFSIQKILRY